MEETWCLNEREFKEAEAALMLAKKLGFIEEAGFEALEERRRQKNEEIRQKLNEGETVYGLTYYCAPAYLQYELTRFRLDFASMKAGCAGDSFYREVAPEEKKKFYSENADLFTRYLGDLFSYEEVEDVIEKRIREEEYDGLIRDLLCECKKRQ